MLNRYPPGLLLIVSALMLLSVGLVIIYSSSSIYALERFGNSSYFFLRQMFWIVLGLSAALFFSIYDHRNLKKWVFPSIIITEKTHDQELKKLAFDGLRKRGADGSHGLEVRQSGCEEHVGTGIFVRS